MKLDDINIINEKLLEKYNGEKLKVDIEMISEQEGFLDAIFILLKNNIKLCDDFNTKYEIGIDNLSEFLVIRHGEMINKIYYQTGNTSDSTDNENIVLPLGSIVRLSDGEEALIIGRVNTYDIEGIKQYTDYEGVNYPLGKVDEKVMLFNHEDIIELIFVGCQDEGHMETTNAIKSWLDDNIDTQQYNRN